MNKNIVITNATQNNLKNVCLEIKKNEITIFTGVSGSGKSSIVFDVLAQECGRLLNETYSAFTRRFLPKYIRPEVESVSNLSLCIVVDQKQISGNSRSTVGTISDVNALFRLLFSRFSTNNLGSGNYYSFNDPLGMCDVCLGIGVVTTLDLSRALDYEKSLNGGAILLPQHKVGSWLCKVYTESGFFDNDKKIKDYSDSELNKLLYGEEVKIEMGDFNMTYEGIVNKFVRQNINSVNEKSEKSQKKISEFTTTCTCDKCGGRRFNQRVYDSKVGGYDIASLFDLEIGSLVDVVGGFELIGAESLLSEISYRLNAMRDIGIGYLSLSRKTGTLSGGESQRLKMVKHLSSSLTDVLYIFDEPSTGLHPRDVHLLNEMLVKLRDSGNTVVVVEHDPDVIKIADTVVDVGPGPGVRGGNIEFVGSYDELLASDTVTSRGLRNRLEFGGSRLDGCEFLESSRSSLNNLKDVSLRVVKGGFNVVTGVAGSGKSTLVSEVFFREFDNVVLIDQSGVHATKRSSPATFVGVMDDIRKLFSKSNDVAVGNFSSNSIGGCEKCGGSGEIELNLSFMEPTVVVCDICDGKRFKDFVLEYKYNGLSILDALSLSVDDAVDFFELKKVKSKLMMMQQVGLGYLTLSQPLSTLSGGELQRLKLAVELGVSGNIYILDEPTTGLHMSDVGVVVDIIRSLVARDNTVIVIEHNVDVIRSSDYIVDMGPDGGSLGGRIVFEGLTEDIMSCEDSVTAKYLR